MGKKIFSLCMALALCLGLLPVTALAVEGAPHSLYVGNTSLSLAEDSYWTTVPDTGLLTQCTGSGDDWNVKYESSSNTLTLREASIQGGSNAVSAPYDSGIYALSYSGQPVSLTIKLIGENTITGFYGIFLDAEASETSYGTGASLTITSENNGSLQVSGLYNGIYVKSGTGNVSLTINDASVVAKTTQTYSSYAGVYVQSSMYATNSPQLSLKVDGGSLTASGTGSSDGILFYVGSSQATGATTSLTVSDNAIVDAKNGGISAGGVSVKPNVNIGSTDSTGGIVFDGKNGTVYGTVELQEDLTIGEGESLTVPEGSSLNCNDNLTNNGTINVESGGTVSGQLKNGTTVTTPSITGQPQNKKVTAGETAEFSVTATAGSETPTYQWQQSTDSGSNWTNIESATSAKYTTEAITTSMSGYQYRCVVKSASGVSVISQAATLTVQAKPAPVSVTGVSLDKATLELYTGDTATLTATVQPSNATNQNVTWQSDNANVATVEGGTVTAVGAGETDITVTTEDGGKTATCTVTVEKPYTPPPYIPPSKPNWTSVARKLANAQPGDTVTVKMNGETEVPGEVWETIAGRDVTVILDMGGNVSWTVDGNDVPTATHFADMDFGVDRNTTGIDVDVINAITGEVSSVQITLAHDGEFGFTLTLTAPLGRENAGYWANLYHYHEDAESLSYETSGEIQEDGTASLKMTHASQYAIIIDDQTHQLPFEDVTSGTWYEGAVRYAYLHDIMEGMSATTFQPNGTLTRAQAVQIFYNLEGKPDISDENLGYPYEDVNAQAWYGNAVYWARLTGVATGYGDGTFQPTDSITRQEFAQMLYNYAKYKGYDLTAKGDLSQFPDSGSVADWAKTAMSWANGNKLINGHDDGTIDAGGAGTRAQAASILMRFDQTIQTE